MTEGERLKDIRKTLGLTLENFGEKIGLKRSVLSRIENGSSNLTDQTIRSICREYHVNYDWLVYGDGEKFENLPETILDEICDEYNCDELDKKLIEEYLKLDSKRKQVLKDYMKKVFGS